MELTFAVGIFFFGILVIAVLYMIKMYLPDKRDIGLTKNEEEILDNQNLFAVQFDVLTPRAILNTPYSVYTDSVIRSVKRGHYAQEPIRDASGNIL